MLLLLIFILFSRLLFWGCAQHFEEDDINLVLFRDILQLARTANDAQQCDSGLQHRQKRIGLLIRQVEEIIESDLANISQRSADRSKRAIKRQFFRRRIAIPPGTRLSLTPTLQMPFVPGLPDGFLSNLSISFPFTSE